MNSLEISVLVIVGFIFGNITGRFDSWKDYTERVNQLVLDKVKPEKYWQRIYFYALIGLAKNVTTDVNYLNVVNVCITSAKEVVDEEDKVACQVTKKSMNGES